MTSDRESQILSDISQSLNGVEGHLSDKEIHFLYYAAAHPTTTGEILEIGSFKGKSTVVLAKSAASAGTPIIHSVDPLTSPSETDPDLGDSLSCETAFFENIKRAGVSEFVDFHQDFSHNYAKNWTSPIRLLWIDGDHTYRGAKRDFDSFSPYLSNGAIIAFHDVLHRFDGPIRVFIEDVLFSNSFGAAGCCGSIGWAQYCDDPSLSSNHLETKHRLYSSLSRILPYAVYKTPLHGLDKYFYKIKRARIPHGPMTHEKWTQIVNFFV